MLNIIVGYLCCIAAYLDRDAKHRFWFRWHITFAILNFTVATAMEIVRTL